MSKKIFLLVPIIVLGTFFVFNGSCSAAYGDTTRYLGRIYTGDGGDATKAFLDFPEDVAFDPSGNMYIADTYNNVIRKVNTSGKITTYAGTGSYGLTNGAANVAEFALPKGVSADSSGNVFVADTSNNQIRKIDIYGSVSTFVSSGLSLPEGIIAKGNYLYVADTNNNAIKKVSRATGAVTTLTTSIKSPRKMDISSSGSYLYVADEGHYRVVRVNTLTGAVSVIAGSGAKGYKEGVGTAAQFRMVYGIGYDASGNSLYVTDEDSSRVAMIRKINLSTNETSQFVYDTSMTAVHTKSGIKVRNGYVYLAGTGTIHRYNLDDADLNNIVAGSNRFGYRNGSLANALIGRPYDIVMSPDHKYMYLAENNKVRRINLETGMVSLVIGNSIDSYTFEKGQASTARFSYISGITINSAGTILYVADHWNNRIRGINIANQTSFLVSGTGSYNTTGSGNGYREGLKNTAKFDLPSDLVISPDDKYLYVTDTANNRIRKVRISDGQTSLVTGSGTLGFADGAKAAVKFNQPFGIDIDSSGQYLFIADRNNFRIRKVRISDGYTVTLAGDGRNGYLDGLSANSVLSYPVYVKYYANKVFFTDAGSARVRMIELGSSVVKLVSGSGQRGYLNGTRKATEFNNLTGLEIDEANKFLYVGDCWNDMIRKIDINGQAPYTDPAPVADYVTPNRLRTTSNTSYQAYVNIYGSNFRHGAKVQFGDYQVTTYVESSSKLTLVIPLGQMPEGYYDVKVTNSDGQFSLLSIGFAVSSYSGTVPNTFYTLETGDGFIAYTTAYRGGVKSASGDVDKDGTDEIITGTNAGGGPEVKIFDVSGNLKGQFMAYDPNFRGGFDLDVGDVDGDGRLEIVTGAGAGGGPHVRVFSASGRLKAQFMAYALDFKKGLNVAVGDVNNDGKAEIITGTASDSAPHVRVFNGTGKVLSQFFAYPMYFRIGINVLASDLNNDGKAEIITSPVVNGGPHIKVFNYRGLTLSQFFAYGLDYRGGVYLASGDVNGDGVREIITGTSDGKAPHVRFFNAVGALKGQFFAFNSYSRRGVFVSSGDVNNDSLDEIICTTTSGAPEVVIYDDSGSVVK